MYVSKHVGDQQDCLLLLVSKGHHLRLFGGQQLCLQRRQQHASQVLPCGLTHLSEIWYHKAWFTSKKIALLLSILLLF